MKTQGPPTKTSLRPTPTDHQIAVRDFIKEFTAKNRRGPKLREIGQKFGIGRQAVSNICARLKAYGLIQRPGSKSRRVKVRKETPNARR